ncbi:MULTISPECIES: hypothetical protein [unclassified Streptomyces]|uniref:hypothetical protein n=1 Tax=unclassified Streptomyces TaxID=2593676 RepID=UPI0033B14D96
MTGTRHPDHARVERTTALAEVIEGLGKQRATILLAKALFHASDELIGEKLQIHPDRVRALFRGTVSQLRHPARTFALREYVEDDYFRLIDDNLRALMRRWKLEQLFAPLCAQCGQPVNVPRSVRPRTGRPRRYCSNACRQKGYRDRRR